jgi:catechol 2,3-dioxygenase-like lactoylglutathione lyase family enzyme
MRVIGVADLARSAAFYRNVLGFEIREDGSAFEAVSGPARLHFGEPSRSSSVFFETDKIEDMHAAISARGGFPSRSKKSIGSR